jgi:hypothetical protein
MPLSVSFCSITTQTPKESSALIQFTLKHSEFESIPLAGENFTIGAVYTASRARLAEIEGAIVALRKANSWQYDSLVIGIC